VIDSRAVKFTTLHANQYFTSCHYFVVFRTFRVQHVRCSTVRASWFAPHTHTKYTFVQPNRSKSSTSAQLLDCINVWTLSLHNCHSVDVIYFDFAKALDTVSHLKLIYTLRAYGFCETLFELRAMPFSQNQIWGEFRQDWSTLILWLWLAGDRARKSCVSSNRQLNTT